jgi:hypothetical protein
MPIKREEIMKRVSVVLGLALLMGCANSGNNDCPRKDRSCGKNLTNVESPAVDQNEADQTAAPGIESITPSN